MWAEYLWIFYSQCCLLLLQAHIESWARSEDWSHHCPRNEGQISVMEPPTGLAPELGPQLLCTNEADFHMSIKQLVLVWLFKSLTCEDRWWICIETKLLLFLMATLGWISRWADGPLVWLLFVEIWLNSIRNMQHVLCDTGAPGLGVKQSCSGWKQVWTRCCPEAPAVSLCFSDAHLQAFHVTITKQLRVRFTAGGSNAPVGTH